MKRLTRKTKIGRYAVKTVDLIPSAFEKLGEYEDLEEQGLLLRLPCKVGNKVYSIEVDKIEEYFVSNFDVCSSGIYAYQGSVFIGKMGYTVFATKEEAEQALAKMKEGV